MSYCSRKKGWQNVTLDVDVPEVKVAMFAQGTGVVADIEIWHKRIGHVNVQRLKSMQNQNIVTGIPKFKVDGMQGVCAACQLGKQSKAAFPHDKHVSKDVIAYRCMGSCKDHIDGGMQILCDIY